MSNVDLSALRIDESAQAVPRRPVGQRLLVLAVIGIALAVTATFLWPILWPPRAVHMAPVRAAGQTSQQSTIATTEAVGWVEADPYAIIVRPLVSGHIESLMVLEGDLLKAGETLIAKLASADLLAARDRAVASTAEHEAARARATADQTMAAQRLTQNADARLRVQQAMLQSSATDTKLMTARARLRETKAQAVSATAHLKAQQRLEQAGQSYPVALERAQAEADSAAAKVMANQEEIAGFQRELAAHQKNIELCEQLAGDPVDLRGAHAVASAAVKETEAALSKARVEQQIAERELGWATVRSPVDGVVLRLEAEPGDMVGHGTKGIVAIYQPGELRARIDVPLDSLAGIHDGQKVEVTSEAIGDVVVHGVVQRLQHETDLLKNTLQVKIGLIDPPALLRPETLCRARFLASEQSGEAATIRAFRVPKDAVRDGNVFVFDPAKGIARGITVEVLGEAGTDRIVRGELSPTQVVVTDAVTDGEAVREITP